MLSQDENYSVTYALQYAKYPNVKSKFYQDIVETPNTNSLLVLVNQNYHQKILLERQLLIKVLILLINMAMKESKLAVMEWLLRIDHLIIHKRFMGNNYV